MATLTESVGVAEAKRRFSDLLGRVAYGRERIAIVRRGRPMAWLVPASDSSEGLGAVKGWLPSKDPFFREIGNAVKNRKRLPPRSVALPK